MFFLFSANGALETRVKCVNFLACSSAGDDKLTTFFCSPMLPDDTVPGCGYFSISQGRASPRPGCDSLPYSTGSNLLFSFSMT